MTLSAALDSGVAVGLVVIFFGIVFPGWMSGFRWWGTEVFKQVSHVTSMSRKGRANFRSGLRLESLLLQNRS